MREDSGLWTRRELIHGSSGFSKSNVQLMVMFLDGILFIFRLHDYCSKHFEKKPKLLKDEGSLVPKRNLA